MSDVTTKEATSTTVDLPPLEDDAQLPSVSGALEVQDTENIIPIRPDHLTDEENERIQQEVEELAQAIRENPSDVDVTAKVYAIGEECMQSNTRHVELMDEKIGPVMAEVSTEATVPKTLTQIKAQLDLVNPNVVGTEEVSIQEPVKFTMGLWKKSVNTIVSKLPYGREKIMEMVNERRDTVKSTIDGLKEHLLTERDKALKNAIQLGQLSDQLSETKEDLHESVYFAQLLWQRLNTLRAEETGQVQQQALMYLTNDLAMRVIDLQTVDQLNMQSRMGAETLINNCQGLRTLVHRVSHILLPSVMNVLVVKAAAAQQKQLAGASRDVMSAASDTIRETSRDIRGVAVDVAKMNSEGMLDLDKLEEACQEYEAMQTEIKDVITEAERNARGVSTRLGALNKRMKDRVDPMTAARHAREQSGIQ